MESEAKVIVCPQCKTPNGSPMVLGKWDGESFSVRRTWHGMYTLIVGESFDVYCSVCGKLSFSRREGHERISSFGSIGFSRIQFSAEIGTGSTSL